MVFLLLHLFPPLICICCELCFGLRKTVQERGRSFLARKRKQVERYPVVLSHCSRGRAVKDSHCTIARKSCYPLHLSKETTGTETHGHEQDRYYTGALVEKAGVQSAAWVAHRQHCTPPSPRSTSSGYRQQAVDLTLTAPARLLVLLANCR